MGDASAGLTGVLAARYAIAKELGRGGMATVYLAQDLRHGSRVAVKVLRPELASLLGEDRFAREIRITARLQHPNILPVLDSGEAQGLPFYVMPYIEGESLGQRLEREDQLPIEDAVAIASEVAEALAFAHSEGFVHRDIKPSNILLTHGHTVLADFGIARAIDAVGGDSAAGEFRRALEVAYKDRYRFLNWSRVETFLEGFGDEAVDFLFRESRT